MVVVLGQKLTMQTSRVDTSAALMVPAATVANTVTLAGNQVHLDTPMSFIKVGLVTEQLGQEFGVQLAIDDIEDVQVERCGDAAGIVISGLQDGAWLEQVGANQQTPVLAAMCAYASEKAHGVAGLEVAD